MKKMLFVSACVVALSASGAFAQSQPGPGVSQGNVGPGARTNMPQTAPMKKGTTTGMNKTQKHPAMGNSSSEGNVGPGTNNNGGPQPGGR
jgi:hypothetical protein